MAGLKTAIENPSAEEARSAKCPTPSNDRSQRRRRGSLVPLPPTLAERARQAHSAQQFQSATSREKDGETPLDRLVGRLDDGGRGEGEDEQECGRRPGWRRRGVLEEGHLVGGYVRKGLLWEEGREKGRGYGGEEKGEKKNAGGFGVQVPLFFKRSETFSPIQKKEKVLSGTLVLNPNPLPYLTSRCLLNDRRDRRPSRHRPSGPGSSVDGTSPQAAQPRPIRPAGPSVQRSVEPTRLP